MKESVSESMPWKCFVYSDGVNGCSTVYLAAVTREWFCESGREWSGGTECEFEGVHLDRNHNALQSVSSFSLEIKLESLFSSTAN